MDAVINNTTGTGALLTPAQSQLIILNVKRVLSSGDISLLGRIAYRFLISHFPFCHTDTHFNFVTYYQQEHFILFAKTIVNANRVTHENILVQQTLEGITLLCQEALSEGVAPKCLTRAA